jgi:hypothetical protein
LIIYFHVPFFSTPKYARMDALKEYNMGGGEKSGLPKFQA